MKPLSRLVILLLVLVTFALFFRYRRTNALSRGSSQGVPLREKVYPQLALPDAQKIVFTDDNKKTVTVEQKEGRFGIAERDGYPASLDTLGQFATALADLKIQDKIPAPSTEVLQELGVVKPGEGTPEQTGIAVDLYKADNSALASFVLGTEVKSSGGRSQQQSQFGPTASQRTLKTSVDKDTVWVVPADFTVEAEPKSWIDKKFVNVQKIKRVEVKRPDAAENWIAERKDEAADAKFALLDAKPGEEPDETKFTALASLLSSAYFDDVLPKSASAAPDFWKDATEATLTTFEGFTYNLKLKERKEGETTNHLLSITPEGAFPEQRPPVADEKEEDKKQKDEEFAASLKTLKEKLATEKNFAPWVYVVNDYAVSAITKKRADLMKEKPAAPATPGTPGSLPPGHPEVTAPASPPLPAPLAPPAEVAPAGSDPAKPNTEPMPEKPVVPPADVPAPPPANPEPAKPNPEPMPEKPAPPPAPVPPTDPVPAPLAPVPVPESPAAPSTPAPVPVPEPMPEKPAPPPEKPAQSSPEPMPESPAAPSTPTVPGPEKPVEPAPPPSPAPTPEKPAAPMPDDNPAPTPSPTAPAPGVPASSPAPEKASPAAPAPATPAPSEPAIQPSPGTPIPETPPGSSPATPVPTDPTPAPAPEPLAPSGAPPAPNLLAGLFLMQVTAPVPVEPLPAPLTPTTPLPTPDQPGAPTPVEPLPAPIKPAPEPGKPSPTPVEPLPAPVKPTPEPGKPMPTPVEPLPAPVKPGDPPVPALPLPTPEPAKPVPAPEKPLPAPAPIAADVSLTQMQLLTLQVKLMSQQMERLTTEVSKLTEQIKTQSTQPLQVIPVRSLSVH